LMSVCVFSLWGLLYIFESISKITNPYFNTPF
jgi:hypothetical protein